MRKPEMEIISFKGRKPSFGKKVLVYKNLNNGLWSIRCAETNKVLAHGMNFSLVNCSFKVLEGGRQRVIREKQKNVHAYAVGYLTEDIQGDGTEKLTYNPYDSNKFSLNWEDEIETVERLEFTENGAFAPKGE